MIADFHSLLLLAEANPNVFDYFGQSNLAGKAVIFVLIFASLAAWTVMVGKYLELNKLRGQNLNFQRKFKAAEDLLDGNWATPGPFAELTREAVATTHQAGETTGNERTIIGLMENAIQRTVAQKTIDYESRMVILGSIVTGAPFLGLLGTVWGVMDAFGSMGLSANASIQNLAPGVSGALLTTVAGLLVAIPSVFGYNFLLTQTKIMITELENFASLVADRLEIEILERLEHPEETS